MRTHVRKTASALLATLLAVSIASPSLVWADNGGRDDKARAQAQAQAQAKQAQQRAQQQAKEREQKEQRERAEQAKREREKQEQARAAQAKATQEKAAREKADREKAQQAQLQERERNNAKVLSATDTRDNKPSDHPSGKDRNDERGASFPQGASRSNPDGGGVDKPFAVGSLAAGSQGRGDFDGNNGCGNDNDFADDNNGKCLGRQVSAAQQEQKHEPKTEVAGVQTQADEKPTLVADDDKAKHEDKAKHDDKKDERREAVKSDDHDRKHKHHWWMRFWEWCREVLGKSQDKPEVAGTQVQAPTPTHTATSVPKPTHTPQVSGAKAINDHECVPTEWHWVLNQLDREADAPRAISVTWANGQTIDVPLEKFTGKVAHYTTTANFNLAVVNATAVAPAGWSGQFNLSHGPCFGVLGTQATAEPSKTPEPTHTAQPTATNTPPPTATNTPIPTATVPPTPTLGSSVLGKVTEGHECITYEWHWVITQLDSAAQAPSFIRVTWANGQTLDVARTGFTGQTAHYTIGINLNSRVTSAVAGTALPSGWSGQFNLSHGPCL